jgi:hypothetical protein
MYWIPFVTKIYLSSASLADIYDALMEETCENKYQIQKDSFKKFTGSIYMDSFKLFTTGQPRNTLRPVAVGTIEDLQDRRQIQVFFRPTISAVIFLIICFTACFAAFFYALAEPSISILPFVMVLFFIVIAYVIVMLVYNIEVSRFDNFFDKI